MNNIYIHITTVCIIAIIAFTTYGLLLPPSMSLYNIVCINLLIAIWPIYLASEHLREINKLPYCNSKDALRIKHSRILVVDLECESVFDLVYQFVSQESEYKVTKKDSSAGIIQGSIPNIFHIFKLKYPYWLGNYFQIILNPLAGGRTECTVYIWPKMYIQVYDNGLNLIRIEKIVNYIKNYSP